MPPSPPLAELPLRALVVTVMVPMPLEPSLKIPPPVPDELPLRRLALTVSVALPLSDPKL
jgi:hypothetical protein